MEQHRIGIHTFIERYDSVKAHLIENGWQFEDVNGKTYMTHPEAKE